MKELRLAFSANGLLNSRTFGAVNLLQKTGLSLSPGDDSLAGLLAEKPTALCELKD
jgi:hypothetical protein